jgi:hypothetical protein
MYPRKSGLAPNAPQMRQKQKPMYGMALLARREHVAIGEEEAPTGLNTGDALLGEWQC